MITVSLFTPTHDTKWLPALYASIKDQSFDEWVIVYNNGAEPVDFGDARVKTVVLPFAPEWVGPLKAYACAHCSGDVLLEMDHDDMLLPGAIDAVRAAFADPEVGFVYSNALFCDGDGNRTPRFDLSHGWEYREVELDGKIVDELVHFAPSPASCSRIWYAPNHLRAFRRSVYEELGGYNTQMRVLDDQDLISRMYCATKFVHIDRPLYVYRVHGSNSWIRYNAEIQANVMRLHDQYIEPMAVKWAKDEGLLRVDLGGRIASAPGYLTVDLRDADIVADLNTRWPFEDGSVGVVRAMDVFEHLSDPIHTMQELYRVLAPGGYAMVQVPSTDGRGAFQDPTHVSFWNENSFLYYTDREFNRYIDCPVRFQAMRLFTTEKDARQVCWTVAHLMKLDTGRVPGIVSI